jgi:hypothetical protein
MSSSVTATSLAPVAPARAVRAALRPPAPLAYSQVVSHCLISCTQSVSDAYAKMALGSQTVDGSGACLVGTVDDTNHSSNLSIVRVKIVVVDVETFGMSDGNMKARGLHSHSVRVSPSGSLEGNGNERLRAGLTSALHCLI